LPESRVFPAKRHFPTLSKKSHLPIGGCLETRKGVNNPLISPLKAFFSQKSTDYGVVTYIDFSALIEYYAKVIDEVDRQLIIELQRDGRYAYAKLAQKTQISLSTVYRRVQRLLKDEVMSFKAVVDSAKVGYLADAIVAFDVDPKKIDSVCSKLVSYSNISFVAVTFGRFDILTYVHSYSPQTLMQFIREHLGCLDGVMDTEAFLVSEARKRTFTWLVGEETTSR
jgi:Lrp/AsnC family transcriptional regulator for asnA, asnC and gidA